MSIYILIYEFEVVKRKKKNKLGKNGKIGN